MFRTHTCNDLKKSHVGQTVTLSGWVNTRRDHGGLIFIDLRDRFGITQVKFDPSISETALKTAEQIRSEWVIKITGEVIARPDNMTNKNLATGEIEVAVKEIEILSEAKTTPFEIDQDKEVNEETRMVYRYLDLRRNRMKNNIVMRHEFIRIVREYLNKNNFLDIETPALIKGTPEGAREFIVPSRQNPGAFYVLPQSPQQLKQLLMVAGFDRYYQIVKCFRDEDQRGDRQPEFTQIDMELSFVEQEDILKLNEEMMIEVVSAVAPQKELLFKPFARLTYDDAMNKYGSDKPDLRYDLAFNDVTEMVKDSGFSVFAAAVKNGGVVKALRVPGGAVFTRKEIDDLTEVAKTYHAKGLAYITLKEEGISSPIIKFLGDDLTAQLVKEVGAVQGDIIFFAADGFDVACESLGQVRREIAKRMKLADDSKLSFVWVVDFPLFKSNDAGGEHGYGKVAAVHHPFTRPLNEDIALLDTEPLKVRSNAYDLVLNGYEVGGGSMRIHEQALQRKVFTILGISDEEATLRFGHMLKAFEFGAPPHGGLAFGLDRLLMILRDESSIREVMAFPKTGDGRDLMLGAPSEVDEKQLKELHVKLELPKKKE